MKRVDLDRKVCEKRTGRNSPPVRLLKKKKFEPVTALQ